MSAYENYDASSFRKWYYEKNISVEAKEQGFIESHQEGYTVSFPESALIEGCNFSHGLSSINISKENPPFKKPAGNSVNDYPAHLNIKTSTKDILYYPLEIKQRYVNAKNFFLYATQKDFIGTSWSDEKSNYLIIEVRGDRYYSPNKALQWSKPLAIIFDILTAPLQILVSIFLFGRMMINGVGC